MSAIHDELDSKVKHRTQRKGKTNRLREKKQATNLCAVDIVELKDFLRRSQFLSLAMIYQVSKQLGYFPSNIVDIGAFQQKNLDGNMYDLQNPLVAILYPLNSNQLNGRYSEKEGVKPFPTAMWITCPLLHMRISKLEDIGWIIELQKRLREGASSQQWLLAMCRAHQLYAEFRWNLLLEEDKQLVITNGWEKSLRQVGIAGMRTFDAVKCLHGHYAHYLAKPEHGNVIGLWVHELLSNQADDLPLPTPPSSTPQDLSLVIHTSPLTEIDC